jgi:hypothetical protein
MTIQVRQTSMPTRASSALMVFFCCTFLGSKAAENFARSVGEKFAQLTT